jgi:hypothetical protein
MKTYRFLVCSASLLLSLLFPAVQRAGEIIRNQTYEPGEPVSVASADTIETNDTVTVRTGADVLFASAQQITLNQGFQVEQGAIFRAWVPSLDDMVLIVLDGDGQAAPAGSLNANPFDIAVWHGSTPLANQPVTFTVEQGGGLLSATRAGQGAPQLTLASDAEGTVQAYYRHGPAAGVLSAIRVDAVGKTLTLKTLSGSATPGGEDGTGGSGDNGGSGGTGTTGTGGTGTGGTGTGTPGSGEGCPYCNGTGEIYKPCDECGGHGWTNGHGENDLRLCPYCNHGEVEVACPHCHGTGRLDGFDAWALAHGLNPNAPYADSNGNGICDLAEYLMTQDPNISGAPIPGFEIFSPQGDSAGAVVPNQPASGYVMGGLIQHFDADNNTGSGHSATATTWKDLSNSGNDGTLQNYSMATWQANHLPFNGANQYVTTPLNLGTLNMSFTVHVVVLMQNGGNYRGIFGGHTQQPGLVGGQWQGNTLHFSVEVGTTKTVSILSAAQAPLNTVTCYDMVVESGTVARVYKNGALLMNNVVTGAPISQMTSAETMTLGRAYNAAGRYLLGNIYNFMVYNRPLTATEVAQNYACEKTRLGLP